MVIQRKLNLNIADRVMELEELMREFMSRRLLYNILFRGRGLEFDSYRDFSPDDDAIMIDWKASARANKLLARKYIEERDLKIIILVDVSDNMLTGSVEKIKCEYAAEISAALGHLIITSGDNLGFGFFSDKIIKFIRPKKGITQFSIFVDELSDPELYGGDSDIKNVLDISLDFIDESMDVVIFVSDFLRIKRDSLKLLSTFADKFDTIALIIRDPLDRTMPEISGEVVIENPATGEQMIIDPKIAKKQYEKNALEQENMVKTLFTNANVDYVSLYTEKPCIPFLADFLKERVAKGRYVVSK